MVAYILYITPYISVTLLTFKGAVIFTKETYLSAHHYFIFISIDLQYLNAKLVIFSCYETKKDILQKWCDKKDQNSIDFKIQSANSKETLVILKKTGWFPPQTWVHSLQLHQILVLFIIFSLTEKKITQWTKSLIKQKDDLPISVLSFFFDPQMPNKYKPTLRMQKWIQAWSLKSMTNWRLARRRRQMDRSGRGYPVCKSWLWGREYSVFYLCIE